MFTLKTTHCRQGKAPHFLTKPTIKQERLQLLMTCNLEAKPEPKLSWFRDNTEITNGGRYTLALKKDASGPDRYIATLTVKVKHTNFTYTRRLTKK
jgi:hypothetical protein